MNAHSYLATIRSCARGWLRQWLGAPLVAAVLVLTPPLAAVSPGAGMVFAQGEIDLGILSPSFQELPPSVAPGEAFTITAATAPGARCAGWIVFRNHPPVELASQAAPSGLCSWLVTVPPTARHGTANIGIEIARSGQSWALYGVTFVSPIGEGR